MQLRFRPRNRNLRNRVTEFNPTDTATKRLNDRFGNGIGAIAPVTIIEEQYRVALEHRARSPSASWAAEAVGKAVAAAKRYISSTRLTQSVIHYNVVTGGHMSRLLCFSELEEPL